MASTSSTLKLCPKTPKSRTKKPTKPSVDIRDKATLGNMSSPMPEPLSDALVANGVDQYQPERAPSAPQAPYKSFRKKWRKMRINFDHAMEEANDLFVREHKAWDIARRLQEQNDQLLDMIADLELDAYPDKHLEDSWQQSLPQAFNLNALLEQTVHSGYPLGDNDDGTAFASLPPDLHELPSIDPEHALPPGFMTTEHEATYLDALDASLAYIPPTEQPSSNMEAVHPPPPPRPEKRILREDDFAARHPNSVHNWLRTNKPEMFVDKERLTAPIAADKASDRSVQSPAPVSAAAAAGKKSGKKKSVAAALADKEKQDAPFESLDEDIGFDAALDQPGGGQKGKRKRDDETYRPKGGSSKSRSRKKGKAKDGEGEAGETPNADAAET